MKIKRYTVLLTCFNRRETTLKCLKQLYRQKTSGIVDVYLCDDGSTDGTFKAVKTEFPDVYLSKGTGNLFWNRGMLASWEKAYDSGITYDAYIWLNDDAYLMEDALQELIDCSALCNDKSIICGSFRDDVGCFSYGGRDKQYKPLIPNGTLQPVYWLNGNCVLVPDYVVKKIGLLDSMFQHHMGDFDYGLRAIEADICIVSTRKYIGTCPTNPMASHRERKSGLTLCKRFRRLYSPLGDNPIINFKYTKRHFGLAKAIRLFLALHFNNLLSDHLYELKTVRKQNSKIKKLM